MTPYNRKQNVLSASLNKTFPSFPFLRNDYYGDCKMTLQGSDGLVIMMPMMLNVAISFDHDDVDDNYDDGDDVSSDHCDTNM